MGDGDRQRIGDVDRTWRLGEPELCGDEPRDGLLVRTTVPRDGLLDLVGAVGDDGQPVLRGDQECDPRRLTGRHGGAHVAAEQHTLDRDPDRSDLGDDLAQLDGELQQALLERPARWGGDAAREHQLRALRGPTHRADAAAGQAGVDTEHDRSRTLHPTLRPNRCSPR